jgi:hypothetical protein
VKLSGNLAGDLEGALTAAGASPPSAYAGPDASHNRFYGASYTLQGSATGTGPITYQWTKVSGTPVPTFADDTDPESGVTFDVAGAVTLRLEATNAYGSSTDTVVITVTEAGLLDGLASAAAGLWCFGCVLRSTYAGAVLRVRREDNDAEADIPQALGRPSIADLTAHCAGTNGFVVNIYDSSGNARTLSQATEANQYKVYDSVTGPVLVNGHLAALATGSNKFLRRADNCGVSGTGAKSMALCYRPSGTGIGVFGLVGSTSGPGTGWQNQATTPSATQLTHGLEGSSRTFTATDYVGVIQRVVTRLQASGTAGQVRLRQNGVELSELSSVNPSTASNLTSVQTQMGRSTFSLDGELMAEAWWGADISDVDAALWESAMQTVYG